MLFNSLHFFFFFIVVTPAFFLLAHQHRWKLLLAASCYFYMTFVPVYILILGFTIVVDYFAGILIETSKGKKRKFFLILSLIANIGVLAIFKYYNFLNENLSLLLGNFDYNNKIPYLNILLPIGLSFHTFQAMSYTIEVYRGNQKAERHFGIYSLYVMFYPQLVAGPIERPQNILPQLHEKKEFSYENVVEGLKHIVWGLFKKVVIADRLSLYVDAVYNNSDQHSGLTLIVATVFFAFQIYCDFSGYSDIAIGCARVMGYRLMMNFRRPYLAASIKEFWSRWHISLSTWFRDYLYFPLGGSKVSKLRWYSNLFIVFMVSGLWHGANWTFIVWGALHGTYQIFSVSFKNFNDRNYLGYRPLTNAFQVLLTFTLVCFAWIFFRANNVNQAFAICESIFTFKPGDLFIGTPETFAYSVIWILFLLIVEYITEYYCDIIQVFHSPNRALRYAGYTIMVLCIILFGVFNGGQFIYFQF
ncbi:D-alanyl-lipoteichoic acid acyltransferase DltB (MBOAT superfamily) [Arcticibacter pallidicorallinus]|uniref:D-alanyl-lipoteichoic acid acyltransferase DltB (MBOAT superfamily) n=1 Tax=Arcticibacter pallidicorallinus TaxID=1259464 RepID=A0A2T0TYR6_9SPHI|nr:MBOAT family O-acyltransferase [Arcticibacter pallidicorallinus]PRY50822.1 D-alanyl-lipoteichoic acid acyltransferase DltB (MBOAT superfamily) [Arcticibacter pallidicorallinus]